MKTYKCPMCSHETIVADDAEIKFCGNCRFPVQEGTDKESDKKTEIASVLDVLGALEIIFGIAGALIVGAAGDGVFAVALFIASIVSGLLFIAFAEVIHLLKLSAVTQKKILERLEMQK